MTVKTIHCDRCGNPGAREVVFDSHRETDAAGSTDTVNESIDLCGECAVQALAKLVNNMTLVSFCQNARSNGWASKNKKLVA